MAFGIYCATYFSTIDNRAVHFRMMYSPIVLLTSNTENLYQPVRTIEVGENRGLPRDLF